MAENKKISQLNPAVAFTGAEKFEILQGGLNLYGTPEQMKEYVGAGPTREFNRAFSAELLFDKNEIAYVEHELTDDVTFTVATSGHLTNQFSSAIHQIVTDGTRVVNFEGFKYVTGDIQSGSIPESGTYPVVFLYFNGVAWANWAVPSSETANLTPLSTPANFAANPGAGDPETEVDLTWDDVANESSYEIYRSSTGGSGPWGTAIATPAAGSTSYTDTGRTPGTTYHYRIRAIGTGAFSNSQYASNATTTEDAGDMTAPTFTFDPADTETEVPVNGVVTITSTAPLRDQDGSTVITNANLSDYLVVKEDDGAGADIPYTATIDATKTIITITPNVVWPSLGDVFIQIDGVESSVNDVHAVADDATFTTSDYTLASGNLLYFGNILDSLFSADNGQFKLQHTIRETLISGTERTLFRKHDFPQTGWLWYYIGNDVYFTYSDAPGGVGVETNARTIKWTGVMANVEQTLRLEYDGSVDTNNGLDRVSLYIDDVLQGSKTLHFQSGSGWPFKINSNSAQLRSGPGFSEIKDTMILSAGDVVEINVPISRTGEDISGNNRDGTWV